ncbi:ATP-dependent RNA helicase RhlE [compost metagenome]
MLDMGFIHDVKKVLAKLPPKRQNLLFSATFSKDITDLANKLLHNPERIEVTPPNTTVERIEQRVFRIPSVQKRALLAHLVTVGAWEQVLVFTRTKHGANRLAEYLSKHGLPAAAIHGNKSQNARTKALADFKANDVRILVATDIAARGLDIDQLPHVVNYELPNVEEDYVHRIGRTGRAGRSGEAISLVSPDEEKLLKAIERLTKQRIPDGDMQGFDPEMVLPEVAQPETREAPQRQPRKNKEAHGERKERKERKEPKERKEQPARSATPEGGTEAAQGDKPASKRRRRGGKGKGRTEGQPQEQRSEAQPRQQQQPRAAQPAKPARAPNPNPNRDPEEFLDDDFDNFGNRADYVSPYQGKDKARGQRQRQGQNQGQQGQAQGGQQRARGQGQGQGQQQGQGRGGQGGGRGKGSGASSGSGSARGGQQGQGQGKQRSAKSKRGGQGRSDISRMSDAPLREPSEYGANKPTRQPVVINKRDLIRGDRFPTAEQLEELEPRRKGERPALLTRNR